MSNGCGVLKSRTIALAAAILACLLAVPAQADRLNLTDSYTVAHKVARRLLNAYQAEVAKVTGCSRVTPWTGRCAIKLYAIYGTGENCAYAITTHTRNGITRSSYYADNCPSP